MIPFLIYIVHVYFHNDGPLQSDILIWYVLALIPFGNASANARELELAANQATFSGRRMSATH